MPGLCGYLSWNFNTPQEAVTKLLPAGTYWRGSPNDHFSEKMGLVRVTSTRGTSISVTDGANFLAVLCRSQLVDKESLRVLLDSLSESSTAALNALPSEFVLCYVDEAKKALLLATDVFGSQPIYYARTNDTIVFSSDLASLRNHSHIDQKLSKQAIFDFLYFTAVPAPQTITSAIHRIPPGHAVWMDQSETVVRSWYAPQETVKLPKSAYEKRLIEGLQQSVSDCWIDGTSACFLSGGLDSSTVCGLAAKQTRSTVPAFSIGFDEGDYDEIPYARVAAKKFALDHQVHYVSPAEVISGLDAVTLAIGEPFANASTIAALVCAELANKKGYENLLAGDGGDELFAGNERYRKQMQLHHFDRLPSILRNTFRYLARDLDYPGLSVLNKGLSYIRQAQLPFARRLQHYNFIEQYGAENIFCKSFLRSVNTEGPSQLIQEIFDSSPFDDYLKRMLYVDWRITLADNDLRKVRTACDIAGVGVQFPMLGLSVRGVAEAIPSGYLMPRGKLRDFYKRAFGDVLPKTIINKEKHGFGVPVGRWMHSNQELHNLVESRLRSLVDREIVTDSFVRIVRESHQTDDATHFGVVLWTIFMLETWFQKNGY